MKTKIFFAMVLMVCIFGNAMAQDEVTVNLYPDKVNLWYLHLPAKGLNFYFLQIWPTSYLLTKFGPPMFTLKKWSEKENLFLLIAAGPDLTVKVNKFSDLFESFTVDIWPFFSKNGFYGSFVNEIGVNKDGKAVHFFRYTLIYRGIGIRASTCGVFGQKPNFFRIGPVFQAKALTLWFTDDTQTGKWIVEFTFDIKL